MANKRISPEKRALILAALSEGTALNSVCRMFKVGIHSVLRVISETSEALEDYQERHFRDLRVSNVAIDECWSYIAKKKERIPYNERRNSELGDSWVWCAMDRHTRLVFSWKVGKRTIGTADGFLAQTAERVSRDVYPYITTDAWPAYPALVSEHFRGRAAYAIEKKYYGTTRYKDGRVKEHLVGTDRKEVFGDCDLEQQSIAHCERVFLTLRQELRRFSRKTLAYSKSPEYHKAAVTLHFGLYNLCRKHTTLGTTPAVAAGIEEEIWTLERVVEMTAEYFRKKEEAQFEAAFTESFSD